VPTSDRDADAENGAGTVVVDPRELLAAERRKVLAERDGRLTAEPRRLTRVRIRREARRALREVRVTGRVARW
jgi:hypothetical protein